MSGTNEPAIELTSPEKLNQHQHCKHLKSRKQNTS